MWRSIATLVITLGASLSLAQPVLADDGLKVSSSRIAMTAKPNQVRTVSYAVTNTSDQSVDVRLQVRQFTADREAHTIAFTNPKYDWLKAKPETFALSPHESKTADFTLTIPASAASQEYHFALIASTEIVSGNNTKTIQVAPLLYLYVEGAPINRTSRIVTDTRPGIAMGGSIPYAFEVKNQGNIHLESRVSVSMNGPRWHEATKTLQKLILPSQSRDIDGHVSSPTFPGIYTLTYASTDDVTGTTTQASRSIIVVPPWSLAAAILGLLLAVWGWQAYRRNRLR